jgi:hypothetical protein
MENGLCDSEARFFVSLVFSRSDQKYEKTPALTSVDGEEFESGG